jgi:hypothetical protein
MQQDMEGIQEVVKTMELNPPPPAPPTQFQILKGPCQLVDAGRCVVSPHWPEYYAMEETCEIRTPTKGLVYPRHKIVAKYFHTESCCDRLYMGNKYFSGEKLENGPDDEIFGRTILSWSSDFSEEMPGWKICAEDIPPPVAAAITAPNSAILAAGPAPAAEPPVAPPQQAAPRMAPSHGHTVLAGARKPTMIEMQCAKLQQLIVHANREMGEIRTFAEHDGMVGKETHATQALKGSLKAGASLLQTFRSMTGVQEAASQDAEATDPDLTLAIRRVLTMQKSLQALVDSKFCDSGQQLDDEDDDDDDDDDEAPAPAPAPKAPIPVAKGKAAPEEQAYSCTTASAGSDCKTCVSKDLRTTDNHCATCNAGFVVSGTSCQKEEPDEEEEAEELDEEEPEIKVDEVALSALLEVDAGLDDVVEDFETSIHPHGSKWWRYRYEYTLIESVVLAVAIIIFYFFMYLFHLLGFFSKFKFYQIGQTSRLYRYAFVYIVGHASTLMVMATIIYVLYMPWGSNNIIDWFALSLHESVDGRANIPYLGYSWFLMFMDVLFQLFLTFALYAIFVMAVVGNFAKALDDWKLYSAAGEDPALSPVNVRLYKNLLDILQYRVQLSEELQLVFKENKIRLRGYVPKTETVDTQDWNDFKLHVYLTDALGEAIEYLVEISWRSNAVLVLSALLVAVLAHTCQMAFMYFLPFFLIACFTFAGIGFYVGHHMRKNARKHDHDKPLEWCNMHFYCRGIQIGFYAIFFSFVRLLLSNDIWSDYPRVYIAAAIGLLLTLLLAKWASGEVMKETLCGIVFPPQITNQRFAKNLVHLDHAWYKSSNCHETGIRQFPSHCSYNKDWVADGDPRDKGGLSNSNRTERTPYSWR